MTASGRATDNGTMSPVACGLAPQVPAQALAALMLAACGGPPTSGGPPTTSGSLALARADGSSPAADRTLQTIGPPADVDGWRVEAPGNELVELDGRRALRLFGGAEHTLGIPGEFRARTFNLVAVEVAASKVMSLRLGLSRTSIPGEPPERDGSTDVGRARRGERTRLLFDVRRLAKHAEPFDELLLLARTGKDTLDWSLLGVELIQRPFEARLPPPTDPDLVASGGDARYAVALPSSVPLRGRARIRRGSLLAFSWAPAPGEPVPPGTRLRVRARDGRRLVILHDAEVIEDGGWTQERIPLDRIAGWNASLLFQLVSEEPALVALSVPQVVVPRPDPPTVLLVTSDTHRADHLGAAGHPQVLTPGLDALAAEGVLFLDCLASSNHTNPSHAALMTGMNPRDTGVTNNATRLSRRATTLAERFRDAGWATYAVVSSPVVRDPGSGLGQGFDRMSWPHGGDRLWRNAVESVDMALRWIEVAPGRPLFLWLHVADAHDPYKPPEEYTRAYYETDRDPYDARFGEPPGPPPKYLRGLRDLEYARALYKGEVSHLDHALARLLAAPRLSDAVIAFTADHGESLGEQGYWWKHMGVYPSVLRVPLILRWPGGPRGQVVERGVRQTDLSRTLLELAGIEAQGFPGEDLTRTLDETWPGPTPRFALGSNGHALALTQGRWHLVVNLRGGGKTVDHPRERPVELFDLGADPGCEQDLAAATPERAARMARALLEWAEGARGGLAEFQAIDEETRELLGELGYAVGDEEPGTTLVDLALLRERLAPLLE